MIRIHKPLIVGLTSLLLLCGHVSVNAKDASRGSMIDGSAYAQDAPTETLLLGHPASWESRFLRSFLIREGHEFNAVRLAKEMSDEDYAASLDELEQRVRSADNIIIHQAFLRKETSARLQTLIAEQVEKGKAKLIFLATGTDTDLSEAGELEPAFARLSPVTAYEKRKVENELIACRVNFNGNEIAFASATLLTSLEMREDAVIDAEITVDETSAPWIVVRSEGEGTVVFIASDDLWRIRRHSANAYQSVWRDLLLERS